MAMTPGQPAPQEPRPWWKALWALLVEVWVGSFLFAILFAPAVGLDLAVKWLRTTWDVSEFLAGLLTFTKYTIAVLDALLYLAFVLNMAWRFVNELRWRNPGHG